MIFLCKAIIQVLSRDDNSLKTFFSCFILTHWCVLLCVFLERKVCQVTRPTPQQSSNMFINVPSKCLFIFCCVSNSYLLFANFLMKFDNSMKYLSSPWNLKVDMISKRWFLDLLKTMTIKFQGHLFLYGFLFVDAEILKNYFSSGWKHLSDNKF